MNETLAVIAEFSIGLAGFSGIISVIGKAQTKLHQFRIKNLLITAFVPGFCALFGLVLLHFVVSHVDVVRSTSAILGIAISLNFASNFRAVRKLDAASSNLLNLRTKWFNIITSTLNIFAQVANAIFPTNYAEGILVAGLVHQLLMAAIYFSTVVVEFLKESSDIA